MEDQKSDIDILLSDAGDFIETRALLWKYKGIESLADVSGELVSGLAMILVTFFVVSTFSVGFALLIGYWLGKFFWGFFVMGGFYSIVGLILYARRDKWLKETFSNMLV